MSAIPVAQVDEWLTAAAMPGGVVVVDRAGTVPRGQRAVDQHDRASSLGDGPDGPGRLAREGQDHAVDAPALEERMCAASSGRLVLRVHEQQGVAGAAQAASAPSTISAINGLEISASTKPTAQRLAAAEALGQEVGLVLQLIDGARTRSRIRGDVRMAGQHPGDREIATSARSATSRMLARRRPAPFVGSPGRSSFGSLARRVRGSPGPPTPPPSCHVPSRPEPLPLPRRRSGPGPGNGCRNRSTPTVRGSRAQRAPTRLQRSAMAQISRPAGSGLRHGPDDRHRGTLPMR